MKKISLVLLIAMFVTVLSGCAISINGKKVVSFNEDRKGFEWPAGNNVAEKSEVKEQDVESQNRINVSNATGKIEFKVWDKNLVQVTSHKKIRAGGDKAKLDKLLDEIKVEVQKGSNNIDVNVRYINGMWGLNNQSVELEIMVPKGMTYIKAHSASGEIKIDNFNDIERLDLSSVSGDVEVKNTTTDEFEFGTTSGSVNIDKVTGNGSIHTVSGEINVRNIVGDVKYKTTSGSIQSRGVEGEADVTTVSGSIDIFSNYFKASEIHSTSGSVNIHADKIDNSGRYTINSISGGINIRLPQESGFELDASSTSGNIRNDFSNEFDGDIGKKSMNGVVGAGGAEIEIHTVSGGINIMK
ncbi:MAG: DUF4097 domain-containing protein [Clostridia bacterium]|nr:DUF4097 domain-containing protein [Clostridia bacterium]